MEPTEMEIHAFIAMIEASFATAALLPRIISSAITPPLDGYIKEFREKYDVAMTIKDVALLAINYYENRKESPDSNARLMLWKTALDAERRAEDVQELDTDFDEDLWSSAFNG